MLRCLRRNVDASCHTLLRHLPPSTKSAAYQRQLSVALEYIALGPPSVHNTRWSQILAEIAIFAYPTCIPRPPVRGGGGARRNIAMTYDMEKLEWFGYTMVKKVRGYIYSFWQSANVTERRTNGRTDTAWPHRPRFHRMARQKLL